MWGIHPRGQSKEGGHPSGSNPRGSIQGGSTYGIHLRESSKGSVQEGCISGGPSRGLI